MIVINLILSYLFLILMLFCFIKEYYSPFRFIKGIITFLKNFKYKIVFLLYLYGVYNLFYFSYFFLILNYIFYIILILSFSRMFFAIHKRGIRLFVISFIIDSSIILLDYKIGILLIFIYPIVSIIMANFVLYPLEELIRIHYLKKAKKKLKKINPIIIGITGSFSKTTFKTYLNHFLKTKYVTYASKKNVNTLMGLTTFINNDLSNLCEVLILEIGIDKFHGIRKFKRLFSLDIGVITSVGNMHLSTFKTYDRLVKSKCEIDMLLKDQGRLFINDNYKELKSYDYKHNVCYFSNIIYIDKINRFQNEAINGVYEICKYLFVPECDFYRCLNNLPSIPRRFEIKEDDEKIVINDSYNINFAGVKEALSYMEKSEYTKIVITGGLIELGALFYEENYKLGKMLKSVDYLFLVSKNELHPLKKGYEYSSNKKCVLIDDDYNIKDLIKDISGKKIILITAIKGDFYLE